MKKPKKVKEFYFKDINHEDLLKEIDDQIPIKLKYNENLINRVCARYPYLSKTEVSIIVLNIFKGFRDMLVLGNIMNFHNLFFDTKLYFFDYLHKGRKLPAMKIKISTPPKLKKIKED